MSDDLMTEVGSEPKTRLPDRTPPSAPVRRRQVRRGSRVGNLDVIGALIASISSTLLLFGRLAPFSGLIAWVVVAYAIFLGVYAVLAAQHESGPAIVDSIVTVFLWSATLLVALTLSAVIVFTVWRGAPAIDHLNFYTHDLSVTGAKAPLSSGGILHAILGTLWTISIASVFTIPLGLVCAFYLSESKSRVALVVRTLVEAMVALPDVLFGLFIFATWILILHFEPSGFAAALALSLAMLPIIVRSAELVLRLVPGSLREASSALGAPKWRTALTVILPTARPGLTTAVILGLARGIGETAPVLLTAGYTLFLNRDPLHGPMVTLPLLAFTLVQTGERAMTTRGFGAAVVLLILVVVLFSLARWLGGRGPDHPSKAKQRRMVRASRRDSERFAARDASLSLESS